MSFITHKSKPGQKSKKKPPPRPPPPDFTKYKSKSTYNLHDNLIEWSPPSSPKTERNNNFGGSVSSSFSSSTSSLASSKKSVECDISVSNNLWPINGSAISGRSTFYTANGPLSYTHTDTKPISNHLPTINIPSQSNLKQKPSNQLNVTSLFGPTIIRPRPQKSKVVKEPETTEFSLPMPTVPPPSPPKIVENEDIPYGIALYDYHSLEPGDLSFQVQDIILLEKKINGEWYYGRTQDREGIFPANYIEVIVNLPDTDNNTVMALYEFPLQMSGDLALKPGQLVKVTRRINEDWLYGESNGQEGQFPSNFVERVPTPLNITA